MTITGVALPDGRLIWARSDLQLASLDRVVIRLPEGDVEGTVLVAPTQLLKPPAQPTAEVVRILPREEYAPSCDDLPGADLPPLGTRGRAREIEGVITALDPVAVTVTITPGTGEPIECPPSEVQLRVFPSIETPEQGET